MVGAQHEEKTYGVEIGELDSRSTPLPKWRLWAGRELDG